MGEWSQVVPYEQPHVHEVPDIDFVPWKKVPGPQSTWKCSCGREWVVVAISKFDKTSYLCTWTFFGDRYGLFPVEGLGH